MSPGFHRNGHNNESAVANLIEYILVSGVIMVLFIVVLLLVNTNIMENPANRVVYVAFTDIGNGVSTRIVDTYSLAPATGNMSSKFDIPDEIVGKSYFVEIPTGDEVIVSRGDLKSSTNLAGIGETEKGTAGGSTTGAGMNVISYDSEGF
jgi:hypothetical protein